VPFFHGPHEHYDPGSVHRQPGYHKAQKRCRHQFHPEGQLSLGEEYRAAQMADLCHSVGVALCEPQHTRTAEGVGYEPGSVNFERIKA